MDSRQMARSVTLENWTWVRWISLISGLGMAVFSALTIEHYFSANFPESIFEGSFCDLNSFFNCDSSAFSNISAIAKVPLGYFGFFIGILVVLGSLFPSPEFEKANGAISWLNVLGVITLAAYSVFVLGSLCLLCSGFYVFSIISAAIFWKYGTHDGDTLHRFTDVSLKYLGVFAVVALIGAYSFRMYHLAREDAATGAVTSRIVDQYFALDVVDEPSYLSPFWSVRSTENFEDAPIRVVEFADFLCPDCKFLYDQMKKLKEEFAGQINVAFQFFPLEAACNTVVEKDKHPGACDLSYMSVYRPESFVEMHDEVFENLEAAKEPAWRDAFAKRYDAALAPSDSIARAEVHRIVETGREYERTSDEYSFGIRSTPTMIINGRMIIGTLPYEQLRAIFIALLDEYDRKGGNRFIENWED